MEIIVLPSMKNYFMARVYVQRKPRKQPLDLNLICIYMKTMYIAH